MNITTKFDLGDKVWHIRYDTNPIHVTCTFCAGTGRIIGRDESKDDCRKCHGKGYNIEYQKMAWYISNHSLTVGQVSVTIIKSDGIETYPVQFDNFKPRDEREERYMMVETGIGSGMIYNVNDLFATREEAEKECDKRNGGSHGSDREIE